MDSLWYNKNKENQIGEDAMDNSFLHSKRLLLVDDEQELLKMVSDILKMRDLKLSLPLYRSKKLFWPQKKKIPI